MVNWTAAYLSLLLWELHIVKDPEDNSKQILPPVFLKGVPIGLHHFEHHCQSPGNIDTQAHVGNFPNNFYKRSFSYELLPGPDIQLTPVDDAGQLKENWEPPPHPHSVLCGYIHVITGVIFEGLK